MKYLLSKNITLQATISIFQTLIKLKCFFWINKISTILHVMLADMSDKMSKRTNCPPKDKKIYWKAEVFVWFPKLHVSFSKLLPLFEQSYNLDRFPGNVYFFDYSKKRVGRSSFINRTKLVSELVPFKWLDIPRVKMKTQMKAVISTIFELWLGPINH